MPKGRTSVRRYNKWVSESCRHSRRDFLRGRAAARAVVDKVSQVQGVVADALGIEPPLVASSVGPPLLTFSRRAMACEFEVQLAAGGDAATTQHVLDALDLLEPLEAQMTVYRSDSDVLRINWQAAEGPAPAESQLLALFQLAARIHRETAGALDITSGPLSAVWGFSRREGRMPSNAEIESALAKVGMDHVELDAENQTVAFRRPGLSLHLNCIGKGYALDRMAEALADSGLDNYLLHGGRSSVLARGDRPGLDRPGWSVGLRHPLRPDILLGEFVLRKESLGTSGSGTQSFEHEGRRYGHLIDPRTGRPVEGMYTATVLANTAAEADALSTAFYIMGPVETAEYCRTHPDVAAVLVTAAEDEGEIRLHTYNLDESRWHSADAG